MAHDITFDLIMNNLILPRLLLHSSFPQVHRMGEGVDHLLSYYYMHLPFWMHTYICRHQVAGEVLICMTYISGLEKIQVR